MEYYEEAESQHPQSQEEYEASMGGYSESITPPSHPKDKEATVGVIKGLSPRKVLEQLRMSLKGFFWDDEEEKYMKIDGYEPLMNDKGIAKYIQIASTVMSDLVTFSNFTIEEAARLTLHICEEAIPVIHVNYKEYGIKEKSNLPIIDIQIFISTYACLKKAVGAGDRGVIGRAITENIINRSGQFSQQMMRQEKKGFVSRLLGGK